MADITTPVPIGAPFSYPLYKLSEQPRSIKQLFQLLHPIARYIPVAILNAGDHRFDNQQRCC